MGADAEASPPQIFRRKTMDEIIPRHLLKDNVVDQAANAATKAVDATKNAATSALDQRDIA